MNMYFCASSGKHECFYWKINLAFGDVVWSWRCGPELKLVIPAQRVLPSGRLWVSPFVRYTFTLWTRYWVNCHILSWWEDEHIDVGGQRSSLRSRNGQIFRQPCEIEIKPFRVFFWLLIKLWMSAANDERMNLIDFHSQRSKVKVIMAKYGNSDWNMNSINFKVKDKVMSKCGGSRGASLWVTLVWCQAFYQ